MIDAAREIGTDHYGDGERGHDLGLQVDAAMRAHTAQALRDFASWVLGTTPDKVHYEALRRANELEEPLRD